MTTRGYKIAVGVTVFLIFAILAAPYLRPYLDDAFGSVTSSRSIRMHRRDIRSNWRAFIRLAEQ